MAEKPSFWFAFANTISGVVPCRSDLRIAIPIHAICQLCTVILERAIIPVGIILSAGNAPAPKPSFFLKTRFLP